MPYYDKKKKALQTIVDDGPCHMVEGVVRSKKTRRALKVRRQTITDLLMNRLVSLDPSTGELVVTEDGDRLLRVDGNKIAKSRMRDYRQKMKTGGWVQKTVWVHEDDLEEFERFMRCEIRNP